jgi:hypothetical protein
MTDTSMMKYQYDSILDQLILLQLHAESPDCPCSLKGTKQGEIGEYCEPKHLRAIVALARESIAMEEDDAKLSYLEKLVIEGSQLLKKMENKLCGKEEDIGDYMTWARDIRKPLEEICYSGYCSIPSEEEEAAEPPEAIVEEIAEMFARRQAEPRWCPPVKDTDRELSGLYRTLGTARKRVTELRKGLEIPMNICRGQAELFQEVEIIGGVLDPYGSRCRDPETGQWIPSELCGIAPAGITTTALGMDGLTRYEFEFKIVSLDDLVISHDPFTFEVNPVYPEELQPRIRERAATKIQVEKIAANLEPDALVTDFHVIDRGAPIIGPDLVVEAGNGRIMGIMRAVADFPENYERYKDALKSRATDYGLRPEDIDSIDNPVLVRVRMTEVDRTAFAQEANQAATIAPSAIENARTDAKKISVSMLRELEIGENQSLEDALRAARNQPFAKRFLATLPENIQAALLDAKGYLNRDGVHRMAMAIFVSAFQGDSGLRLAEKAFESVDMDVRNVVNAIARALGNLAQSEALARSGDRDSALSIGEDLAQTINVYSAIKRIPGMTVDKYLSQSQMFARELTPFQEEILVTLEKYKSSPRKLANILNAYAEAVIESPPPAQISMLPGEELVKEDLWRSAMTHAEEPAEQPVTMFEEACEMPASKYHYLASMFTPSPELAAMAVGAEIAERKIDVAMAQLEEGISSIQESDNFKSFIDTMARFHNYSLGNIMLITVQRPTASRVAGFNTWKDLGRSVKKGEHGIMILAPCFPPKQKKEEIEEEEEEEETYELEPSPVYFKVVYVFDISQTEGEELPGVEVPVLTGEETSVLYQNVLNFIARKGFDFSDKPEPEEDPDVKGYWAKVKNLIWVKPDEPQDQRTKTALHESAHALCEMKGARDAEVMAESVAYVVANHFGFDTGARSFPYVAVWSRDIKVLKANLEIIRKVSTEMIDGIEQVASLNEEVLEYIREYLDHTGAELKAPIKMLTKEILEKIPPLYSQENVEDPTVWVKYFTPDAQWTWYGIEYDGEDIFFGWVVGQFTEMGYFSLSELESVRGPLGLPVERDKWFKPQPLSEVKKLHSESFLEETRKVDMSEIKFDEKTFHAQYGLIDTWLDEMRKSWENKDAPGFVRRLKSLSGMQYIGDLEEGIIGGIAAAAITGMGIGSGMKFVDWLAGKFRAQHEESPYHGIRNLYRASTIPKEIEIFPDQIVKHYIAKEKFHRDSFRITKPEEGILVYLGCLKDDKWDGETCDPNQTVQKTVVPNTPKYLEVAREMIEKNPGIKVTEVAGSLKESDRELDEVAEALKNSEVI